MNIKRQQKINRLPLTIIAGLATAVLSFVVLVQTVRAATFTEPS